MATAIDQQQASRQIGHYVNGKVVAGESGGRTSPVYNPATGEQSATVALASAAQVKRIIAEAAKAQKAWGATPPLRRARVMFRFKALIEENHDRLAECITREHGKTFSDAKGEVTRGLEVVEFACGIPHLLKGEHSPNVGTGVDSHSMQQPVGVCAGITPFNFPVMVPLWMAPVALACGNSFILKPSEKDPSAGLLLAGLLTEAGLPEGVFNLVNGDKEAVDTLLTDPSVGAISFVGSTPIAQYIYTTGAEHGKRVQALGGAKNHAVIMPDADMEQTVDALMGAAYGSAGERCMAISVAVPVGEQTADRLVTALQSRLETLTVGNGLDQPEPEMGPLVTAAHRDKVGHYLAIGEAEGAELVVDGRKASHNGIADGFFIGGSLFDRVRPGMRIHAEEIFGPVLSVVRVADFEEALGVVNGHEFANGTAIFTRDGDTARTYTERVEVGMVGVNVPIPVPMAFHSFGGWKHSRFGVLHAHGPDAVRFYTQMKTVTSRWPQGIRDGSGEGSAFVMPTMR
jgi:malonate-semialdehyde dehydrogenase (acetylating)/methylmalonate-semialdehyde dehydrogenase